MPLATLVILLPALSFISTVSLNATFRNVPLSTSFDFDLETSTLSLDWVLSSAVATSASVASGSLSLPCSDGSFRSMNVELAIAASIPSYLVLDRDWMSYCRSAFPGDRFVLGSRYIHIHPTLTPPAPDTSALDVDMSPADAPFSCVCHDASAPGCPSTSAAVHEHAPAPPTSSLNILRDIFIAHYRTHSRISVFHSDLPAIKNALALHAVPHNNMNLIQCRHALIHHLVSGACVEHKSDVLPHSKLDRSTCAVIAEEFDSAASMAIAALDIILTANDKKMSTEYLCHVAAALNIRLSGSRNLRFKLKAELRKYLQSCQSTSVESRSSVSVAGFFSSFETHLRPALVSIAALHRVELPSKCNVEHIRKLITEHNPMPPTRHPLHVTNLHHWQHLPTTILGINLTRFPSKVL
ncbi:hypothetical protein GGX14DRAFT_397918 [Mycena pura]|uniref:Uncharacterized protein n=1 Tax=Mycena pura TaxID=153505 RepID=A0AAD6VBF9_9AGAR|nr:hypothetical protein GGX14DRAFT_397918 [Mycena pura]